MARERHEYGVSSDEDWQPITTFNEWGEGTAVESAEEWASESGYGYYLDALHDNNILSTRKDFCKRVLHDAIIYWLISKK